MRIDGAVPWRETSAVHSTREGDDDPVSVRREVGRHGGAGNWRGSVRVAGATLATDAHAVGRHAITTACRLRDGLHVSASARPARPNWRGERDAERHAAAPWQSNQWKNSSARDEYCACLTSAYARELPPYAAAALPEMKSTLTWMLNDVPSPATKPNAMGDIATCSTDGNGYQVLLRNAVSQRLSAPWPEALLRPSSLATPFGASPLASGASASPGVDRRRPDRCHYADVAKRPVHGRTYPFGPVSVSNGGIGASTWADR